jgi:hypothetical protein
MKEHLWRLLLRNKDDPNEVKKSSTLTALGVIDDYSPDLVPLLLNRFGRK